MEPAPSPSTAPPTPFRGPAMSKGFAATAVAARAAVAVVAALLVVVSGARMESLTGWLGAQPGPELVIAVEPDGVDLQQAVDRSIRVIERRFYEMAWSAKVAQEGPGRIVVRLGRPDHVDEAIALAIRRGKLELRLV